jgi:hypothetical protein
MFAEKVGVLDDGTPYFAPLGEIVVDGSRVICHLCGRALRSVVAHLPSHGWTKDQYCEAFGLERGQPLEGPPAQIPPGGAGDDPEGGRAGEPRPGRPAARRCG